MSFKSTFGSVFHAAAPFLAATVQMAAPGPLGNVAANIISKVAGKDVKPADLPNVMQALASTDDGLLKLKQADNDYQLKLRELGIETLEKLQEIDAADRDSARSREVELAKAGAKDSTPKALAALACFLASMIIALVFSGHAKAVLGDAATAGLAGTIVGYVFRDVAQVFGYYFGSSSGSDRKTELLAEAPSITQK